MPVIQRLVSPKLPTALATHPCVELPGYDLWLHNAHHIHVLPTELDVPRFEEALSKALQLYPHAAGQLQRSGGRWFIELTNTGVPMEIEYKFDTSSDSFLNGDWVVQEDISPFINHQPIGANLVNSDDSLLRLKLTFLHNETCIGVSWHHTLGDATALSRFMHTLSQFYQGLPPKYGAPSFNKYHFPTPSPSITDEFWPRMPHLHNTRPFTELDELFAEWHRNLEHVRWQFHSHDLAELRSRLSRQKGTYLSQQDCLTAYLVAILNYNRRIPLEKVANTTSYRNIGASFVNEDVAGSLIQDVPVTLPMDVAGIATALRHAIVRCREPEYIHNWMSVASKHMLETANAGQSLLCTIDDSVLTVNSNMGIDWCSAHFGCPDGSRYHTTGLSNLAVRCFKSNPRKGDDGVWRARQSVDVTVGVTPEMKPKLLETLARGIPYVFNLETHARGIPHTLSVSKL